MTNLLSFSPLMRSTVGFDRFNDLFESLSQGEGPRETYPPYNIEKTSEDTYRIVMAVAGFSDKDIDITAEGDSLLVSGKRVDREKEEDTTYLHRGIATREFQRSFRLADHIKITEAEMQNGLLIIHLVRDVPEEEKPRMIPISSGKKGKNLLGKK